ncbi:hypothetical protein [Pedobacter sp. N23S346]|uniref:hypothetical protein n=1 Tax=Pedobacter sp. N23S346 TaxID=3402750 RepID=UPI003ACC6EA8
MVESKKKLLENFYSDISTMEKKTLTERRNDNGINYRGRILNKVIDVEKVIEIFICRYFAETEKKQFQLHFLILGDNRMNLDSKIQVFVSIAKSEHLDWYNSYITTRKEEKKAPDLHKDLNHLIEKRNILAHAYMTNDYTFTPDSMSLRQTRRINNDGDEVVYFNKFQNKNRELIFSKKDIDDLEELSLNIINFIIGKSWDILNGK